MDSDNIPISYTLLSMDSATSILIDSKMEIDSPRSVNDIAPYNAVNFFSNDFLNSMHEPDSTAQSTSNSLNGLISSSMQILSGDEINFDTQDNAFYSFNDVSNAVDEINSNMQFTPDTTSGNADAFNESNVLVESSEVVNNNVSGIDSNYFSNESSSFMSANSVSDVNLNAPNSSFNISSNYSLMSMNDSFPYIQFANGITTPNLNTFTDSITQTDSAVTSSCLYQQNSDTSDFHITTLPAPVQQNTQIFSIPYVQLTNGITTPSFNTFTASVTQPNSVVTSNSLYQQTSDTSDFQFTTLATPVQQNAQIFSIPYVQLTNGITTPNLNTFTEPITQNGSVVTSSCLYQQNSDTSDFQITTLATPVQQNTRTTFALGTPCYDYGGNYSYSFYTPPVFQTPNGGSFNESPFNVAIGTPSSYPSIDIQNLLYQPNVPNFVIQSTPDPLPVNMESVIINANASYANAGGYPMELEPEESTMSANHDAISQTNVLLPALEDARVPISFTRKAEDEQPGPSKRLKLDQSLLQNSNWDNLQNVDELPLMNIEMIDGVQSTSEAGISPFTAPGQRRARMKCAKNLLNYYGNL